MQHNAMLSKKESFEKEIFSPQPATAAVKDKMRTILNHFKN